MVRYFNTGASMLRAVTTGAAVANLENNGVSVISSTAAETYVLQPPVAGCRKTLIALPATSSGVSRVIRMSTNGATGVCVLGATGSTDATQITLTATAAVVIEMVGLSTAQWKVTACAEGIPVSSTGVTFGTS